MQTQTRPVETNDGNLPWPGYMGLDNADLDRLLNPDRNNIETVQALYGAMLEDPRVEAYRGAVGQHALTAAGYAGQAGEYLGKAKGYANQVDGYSAQIGGYVEQAGQVRDLAKDLKNIDKLSPEQAGSVLETVTGMMSKFLDDPDNMQMLYGILDSLDSFPGMNALRAIWAKTPALIQDAIMVMPPGFPDPCTMLLKFLVHCGLLPYDEARLQKIDKVSSTVVNTVISVGAVFVPQLRAAAVLLPVINKITNIQNGIFGNMRAYLAAKHAAESGYHLNYNLPQLVQVPVERPQDGPIPYQPELGDQIIELPFPSIPGETPFNNGFGNPNVPPNIPPYDPGLN